MPKYVCKDHPDTEVNFKGSGCEICDNQLSRRAKKRLARDAKRREEDDE